MSRTYLGGNTLDTRAQSGRQRGEPKFTPKPKEVAAPEGILPLLESANSAMTKSKLLEVIDRAIVKAGG
jgi:hypothetical protein